LDKYVAEYCPKRSPLRYTTTGKYRSIVDYGKFISGIGLHQITNFFVDRVVEHDHNPVNDSKNILFKFLIAERVYDVLPGLLSHSGGLIRSATPHKIGVRQLFIKICRDFLIDLGCPDVPSEQDYDTGKTIDK
jgi:hypothetical protein